MRTTLSLHDACPIWTLGARRPRAGPGAAPATFAQPMPWPTGRKDMRDRQTSWLLAGALVTALAGCTPERAAPVAEPPVTAGDDMPTPASTPDRKSTRLKSSH